MPRLPDDSDEDHDLLDEGRRRASRILHGFIDFAFQGNVLEIAFGLILASMFSISLRLPTTNPQISS